MPFNQEHREMIQFNTEYTEGYNSAREDEKYNNPYLEDTESEKYDAYKEGYDNFKNSLER